MAKDPVVNAILRGVYNKESPVDLDSGKYSNRLQLLKVPQITKERILRVSPDITDQYEFRDKKEIDFNGYSETIELDFMCDSITIALFGFENGSRGVSIDYYDKTSQTNIENALFVLTQPMVYIEQFDVKPYNCFDVYMDTPVGYTGGTVKVIFSRQKKTKISNDVYGVAWNSEEKDGASKDAIYDKIETLSPTTHNHNLNDLTEKNHTSLTNVLTDQHHVKTVSGDINLNDLAEKNHASLANVLADQHHPQIHLHNGETLQLDGINSNGGAFPFYATGEISFYNIVEIKHSTYPVLETIRNSSATNALYGVFRITHETTGDAIDGFGASLVFGFTDNGVSNKILGLIGAIRDGSDDLAKLTFRVGNALNDVMNLNATALTMSVLIAMGANKITGVADPTNDQDAATKKFVDDHNWLEGDITDLDKYTQAQVDSLVGFPVGSIIMFSGAFTNNVTKVGWYICDGNNGTVNLVNKFVRGGSASGAAGGSDDAVVVSHKHTIPYYTAAGGGADNIVVEGITGALNQMDTSTVGVSGVGANKPTYYTLIFIQRIS